MSRTDNTDPWRCRGGWHEVHDHRSGPCDLPPPPTGEWRSPWTAPSRCRWKNWDRIPAFHRCGCGSCKAADYDKKKDLKERMEEVE